jgi:magnesium chelatase family protein
VTEYQKRVSGTVLDRIDIHVEVPRVDYEKLSSDRLGESSATIRERVQSAREWQQARFEGLDIVCPMQESGLSQFGYACGGSTEVL